MVSGMSSGQARRPATGAGARGPAPRSGARLARRLLDHAPVGLALLEADGRFLRVNGALTALTGRTRAELLTLRLDDLWGHDGGRTTEAERSALLAGRLDRYQAEHRLRHPSGATLWVSMTMERLPPESDEPAPLVLVVSDISARLHLEHELRRLSERDPLTGLHNRRFFMGELDRRLAEIRRHGGAASAVVIDLDDFKQINDTYGHAAGDAVLCAVAERLRTRVRDSDLLARIGGDEFAVLLSASDERGAAVFADDVRRAASELQVTFEHRRIPVSASVGLAALDPRAATQSADALLRCADLAMYAAKDARRDEPTVAARRARMGSPLPSCERWLRQALRADGLEVHCAPIVDLATGAVAQHELLVLEPEHGTPTPPAVLAHRTNDHALAAAVDRWAVRTAIELLADGPSGQRLDRLGVDVSFASLADARLAVFVERLLDDAAVPAEALVVEVCGLCTPGAGDPCGVPPAVRALHALGCGLALDHFGASADSFSLLRRLPARALKIDAQFVAGLASTRYDRLIVQAAAAVAHELGITSVATGVQDGATLEVARVLHVDQVQGPAVAGDR